MEGQSGDVHHDVHKCAGEKMFTERVRGEEQRQRQIVMDVAAMEATAMRRDYATIMERVLREAMEATRQEAQRVFEEVTQAVKLQMVVAMEKMASIIM